MPRVSYELAGQNSRLMKVKSSTALCVMQAPIMISVFVFQFTLVNILPSTYTLLAPHFLVCPREPH